MPCSLYTSKSLHSHMPFKSLNLLEVTRVNIIFLILQLKPRHVRDLTKVTEEAGIRAQVSWFKANDLDLVGLPVWPAYSKVWGVKEDVLSTLRFLTESGTQEPCVWSIHGGVTDVVRGQISHHQEASTQAEDPAQRAVRPNIICPMGTRRLESRVTASPVPPFPIHLPLFTNSPHSYCGVSQSFDSSGGETLTSFWFFRPCHYLRPWIPP